MNNITPPLCIYEYVIKKFIIKVNNFVKIIDKNNKTYFKNKINNILYNYYRHRFNMPRLSTYSLILSILCK